VLLALPLLVIVALPAVEVLKNPVAPPLLVIACVLPDVFAIPGPLILSVFPFVLMVKALAPGLKVIDSTVALSESDSKVRAEVLNVAVSPGLTGALGDVDQLVPVFHASEPGLGSQTASRASIEIGAATNSDGTTMHKCIKTVRMPGSFLEGRVVIFVCFAFTPAALIGRGLEEVGSLMCLEGALRGPSRTEQTATDAVTEHRSPKAPGLESI
jgi:hypothetical protein